MLTTKAEKDFVCTGLLLQKVCEKRENVRISTVLKAFLWQVNADLRNRKSQIKKYVNRLWIHLQVFSVMKQLNQLSAPWNQRNSLHLTVVLSCELPGPVTSHPDTLITKSLCSKCLWSVTHYDKEWPFNKGHVLTSTATYWKMLELLPSLTANPCCIYKLNEKFMKLIKTTHLNIKVIIKIKIMYTI